MANPLVYGDTDFTTSSGVVDAEQLRQEFAAATFSSTPVVFSHIDTTGVGVTLQVSVWFDTDPDGTDTAVADALIAAHDATGPLDLNPEPEPDGIAYVRVRNETGSPLLRTAPLLAAVGYNSGEDAFLVDQADKDDPAKRPAFGVLMHDLPNNQNGVAISIGDLVRFDTSSWSVTDQLVLGNAGAFSRPPPDVDPFTGEVQNVGQVTRVHATEGVIKLNLEGQLAVTADGVFGLEPTLNRGVESGFEVTRGGGRDIDVAAGVGFVTDTGVLKRVVFGGDTATIPADSTRFVYVDAAGTLQLSLTLPSLDTNLVLANVRTDATDVIYVSIHFVPVGLVGQRGHIFSLEVIGPVTHTGGVTTINGGDPLGVDVGPAIFYITGNRKVVSSTTGITFTYWYRNGSGGQTLVPSQTQIDPDNYDDSSGTLASIPAGEWKKDALYMSQINDGSGVEYHIVYAQETFSSQSEAEAGALPTPPDDLRLFALRVAGVVSQEGDSAITSIVDERPFLGQLSTGTTASADHGSLAGLGDDDHTQYLLADGTRAMSGNLDMGTNTITNVGTVDGVDVSDHSSRHDPGGSDALTTAAPAATGVGTTSAEGVATSLARSDHAHQSNTAPVNVTKATAAIGTSGEPARADHKHDVTTAAPSQGIGGGNTEGSSTSLARADHDHTLRETGGPTNLTIGAVPDGQFLMRSGSSIVGAVAGGSSFIPVVLSALRLRSTNSSNWAVNGSAGLAFDTVNAAIPVRRFDDTTAEGVGTDFILIPSGATNLTIRFRSRAQTSPPAARTVGVNLYRRTSTDNAAVGSWSSATQLTNINIPTNTNFQYDSQTITLASLSITAGQDWQFQITRTTPTAGTNLSGDWTVRDIILEWS